ncbi:MAG: hypothetical protein HC796_09625 [Synechococcaceae cyanobacterium RL_1_2]|nr:hypothetical protein [Synechococcaceae cyanobacterium RL_1_2]
MRALQIIESGYRCNLEEQDDPAVWISQVLYGLDNSADILLRGNAVNYLVTGQDASGLTFGSITHQQTSRLDLDLANCLKTGMKVYAIVEDLEVRGVPQSKLIPGINQIKRKELPVVFEEYDQIWHW